MSDDDILQNRQQVDPDTAYKYMPVMWLTYGFGNGQFVEAKIEDPYLAHDEYCTIKITQRTGEVWYEDVLWSLLYYPIRQPPQTLIPLLAISSRKVAQTRTWEYDPVRAYWDTRCINMWDSVPDKESFVRWWTEAEDDWQDLYDCLASQN